MHTPSVEFSFPLNQDFADLLLALNARGAKYLVIGGYASGRPQDLADVHALQRSKKLISVFGKNSSEG